jgi:ABC-type arginine transport system permease subunit
LLTTVVGHYVNVSAFLAGTVGLALIFGSYASQVFRGAFLAIPLGQGEAARALGLNRRQVFAHILLPQAWRHALPGLSNLWLVLLKDTALVSLIGLADLMNKSQVAASTTHQPFVFFLTAALLYLIMTSISQGLLRKLTANASRHLQQ